MPTASNQTPAAKQRLYSRELGNGVLLHARVSPCVFTYPGYPLQVSVSLHAGGGDSLGEAIAADRSVDATTYTDATVERLLAAVLVKPCPRCSAPAFDPATVETNRGGLCEACFLADLRAELAAAQESERRKAAARDRRMKRQGMTVRVTAWVHPEDGDDFQVEWYLDAEPTPEGVAALLRREGSCCLDDYEIVRL